MAFFEELGKTISGTGKEVATKARTLTETIQLRTQISAEKANLDEAYAAIGKLFYESGIEPGEAYVKAYEAVGTGRERLAALEIELLQTEGTRICAECGAKVPKESLYCGKCGAPVKEAAYEEAKEAESSSKTEEAAAFQAEEESSSCGLNTVQEDAFESTES